MTMGKLFAALAVGAFAMAAGTPALAQSKAEKSVEKADCKAAEVTVKECKKSPLATADCKAAETMVANCKKAKEEKKEKKGGC
jgi:hypothetical protein